MSCPTPSDSEIASMIGQLDGLITKVTETQSCDADCQETQILDGLKTKLDDSTNNYTTCEASRDSAEKAYTIQKYGINYYNEQRDIENNKLSNDEKQSLIDLFLKKLTETNSNFDTLKNDVNHLNLIEDLYKNTGVNKTLYDVFGIDISPFEHEGFRTIETLNQEIKFAFTKNQTGKTINKYLYIFYYIISAMIIIYLFFKGKYDMEINIGIAIAILLLPLINIVKYIIILISKIKI